MRGSNAAPGGSRASSVLKKLYMHGYMNVDAEPMTFDEVRKLAKQLEIPDFDVMELDKYIPLAKKYKEPANCIIWIPFEDGGSLGHYVSCFREDDGTLNYQDSFGEMNDFPLTGTNRVFRDLCQQLWLPGTPSLVHARRC